jgi:sec-independent protein translocase protein TatB
MLSLPHMIVIFVIVLVVFGPSKLPELARGLGKLMAEFRKASTDFRSAFEQEMHDLDRQAREAEWRRSQASPAANSGSPAPPAAEQAPPDAASPASESVARSAEGDLPATETPAVLTKDSESSGAASPEAEGSPHGVL